MKEYHKIQTVFKRDEKTKKIIINDYTLPEFEVLKDIEWEFTEKVDGTNIRVEWNGEKETITFGGKTDDSQIPVKLLYKLQELFEGTVNKQKFKEAFGTDTVCLYGEGYGASIQKAGASYNATGLDFVLFDVKIGDWWLERPNVENIAQKLCIKTVPIIGTGTLAQAIEIVQKGYKSQWGDFIAEGIVARTKAELFNRKGERIITKIKHRDFL